MPQDGDALRDAAIGGTNEVRGEGLGSPALIRSDHMKDTHHLGPAWSARRPARNNFNPPGPVMLANHHCQSRDDLGSRRTARVVATIADPHRPPFRYAIPMLPRYFAERLG